MNPCNLPLISDDEESFVGLISALGWFELFRHGHIDCEMLVGDKCTLFRLLTFKRGV